MFSFAIMLAVASTIVEMMFAANFPTWRRLAHDYKWINMSISIFLSFVIGVAFGAAGLIAMTAGLISTVLSIPGYAFLHWNYDTPAAQAKGMPRTTHMKNSFKSKANKGKELASDITKLAYGTGKVVTAPLWVPRRVKAKYHAKYPKP